MDTLCLGFVYFGNSRSIKRGSGCFLQTKRSFKDGVRSIRVFSQVFVGFLL